MLILFSRIRIQCLTGKQYNRWYARSFISAGKDDKPLDWIDSNSISMTQNYNNNNFQHENNNNNNNNNIELNCVNTHFNKFSSSNRKPLMVNRRNPQFTKPVKLWKPELHENSESLGRWHLYESYAHKKCIVEKIKCITSSFCKSSHGSFYTRKKSENVAFFTKCVFLHVETCKVLMSCFESINTVQMPADNLRFIWLRSPLLLMAGCYFFGACWASGPSADFIFTILFRIRCHIAKRWDQNQLYYFVGWEQLTNWLFFGGAIPASV